MLSGGTSMFEGIQNRLQKEITEMAGSVVKVRGGISCQGGYPRLLCPSLPHAEHGVCVLPSR